MIFAVAANGLSVKSSMAKLNIFFLNIGISFFFLTMVMVFGDAFAERERERREVGRYLERSSDTIRESLSGTELGTLLYGAYTFVHLCILYTLLYTCVYFCTKCTLV